MLLLGEFQHLFLDFREIGRCESMFARVNVVIKSIFNCRTDAEFHSGVQFLECFCEQVGGRVPESVLAFRIVPFEELDCGVFGDGARYVPLLVVDRCCQNISGKLRAQAFCYLERGYAALELLDRAVGKCNVDHWLIKMVMEPYERLRWFSACKGKQ